MSTLTKKWDVDFFREIISYIDEKTGLNGAQLDIKLRNSTYTLGRYNPGTIKERKFLFLFTLF